MILITGEEYDSDNLDNSDEAPVVVLAGPYTAITFADNIPDDWLSEL